MKIRGICRAAAVILSAAVACGAAGLTARAAETPPAAFTEEERAYIAQAKPLKVGYVRDRRPVSFCDGNGELAGISRPIFDRIAKISGLTFQYVELPEGQVTYDYLLQEGFDLVTGVEYNSENQHARGILISDPYLSSRKVIVAKEGLNFASDAPLTVAISTGSQTIKKVLSGQYPNFRFTDYPTMEACLDAVKNGEADLLIQNQYVTEYWLYKPIYNDLMVIPVMEMGDQLCFSAVTPLIEDSSPEWREKEILISVINKSIAQIPGSEISAYVVSGTLENMYEYTAADFMYQHRYTLVLLGIALLIICLLGYTALRARFRSISAQADAKAKSDFLSTMSHEIRTPLNGLISLNYLMQQNADDHDKITSYLKQSSNISQYLLSLLNNILDMSKLQDREVTLEQKPLDLDLLLETVESVERGGLERKGLHFTVTADFPYPGILGDTVRIQQILLHLLDNARKYTQPGDAVTVSGSQTKDAHGDILTQIRVRDTGRGMSEDFCKQIFQPFTQERDTVSQGNGGTGLGLSICSLLAKRMGGSLTVESALGEGSCFTFTFTAKPAAPVLEAAAAKDAETGSAAQSGGPRILIAEDNELNGQILTELLEEEGFQVLRTENGRKAVEAFERSSPGEYGVILMDLLMPEMNGFEAAEAIRALNRPDAGTVKIYACTANTSQEDRDRAFRSGMDDFIAKPINVTELIRKLRG